MLLVELFELYHRSDIHDDSGKGLEDLVSAARIAGLCSERRNSFDEDLSFDPDAEWRYWGHSEEHKRYTIR